MWLLLPDNPIDPIGVWSKLASRKKLILWWNWPLLRVHWYLNCDPFPCHMDSSVGCWGADGWSGESYDRSSTETFRNCKLWKTAIITGNVSECFWKYSYNIAAAITENMCFWKADISAACTLGNFEWSQMGSQAIWHHRNLPNQIVFWQTTMLEDRLKNI